VQRVWDRLLTPLTHDDRIQRLPIIDLQRIAALRGTEAALRRAGMAWEARRCRRIRAAARHAARRGRKPRAVA
jgi:hypothetical protein